MHVKKGLAVLAAALAGLGAATAPASSWGKPPAKNQGSACRLGNDAGQIKHVVYLQFDNTHYTRDNPDVASDLEQMPHLLNFMR